MHRVCRVCLFALSGTLCLLFWLEASHNLLYSVPQHVEESKGWELECYVTPQRRRAEGGLVVHGRSHDAPGCVLDVNGVADVLDHVGASGKPSRESHCIQRAAIHDAYQHGSAVAWSGARRRIRIHRAMQALEV